MSSNRAFILWMSNNRAFILGMSNNLTNQELQQG
jgi:hypothetical protein